MAHPRSRTPRRLVAALAIVLLAAGVGVVAAVRPGTDPQAVADAYLTALEQGRYGEAASHLAGADGDLLLMTDAIGAATPHRLSGHDITGTAVDGGRAQVAVRLEQGPTTTEVVLVLRRASAPMGLPGPWRLDPPAHDRLRVRLDHTVTALVVNGVQVDASTLETTLDPATGLDVALLPVPPGDYTVDEVRPRGEHQVPVPAHVTAPAGWTAAELPAVPAWELSPEGRTAAREQLSAQIAGCAEMPVPIPSCPFTSPGGRPGTWEVLVEPGTTIGREEHGWYHVRSEPDAGLVRFTPTDASGDPASVDIPFTIDAILEWDETGRMSVVPDLEPEG